MRTEAIDYSRKWQVMVAVGVGVFLATLDGSIVNVALPTLVRQLGAGFATVQWIVLGYLLTLTTLLLSIGRLADMIGKKPLYTSGFVIFTIGSALCGFSPTVYWLIGFRVFQAVGAAMILALGPAIITEAFPPQERGKALGISGAVVSVGIVAGPTLGGVLIEALSWHWIFFVNVPVGIVGALLVWQFVPAVKPEGEQRFDYWGGLALFLALLSLLLALTLGQNWGFDDPRILLLFGLWLVFMVVFLWIERQTVQPMINLALFRNRLLDVNLITGFVTFIAIAGTLIIIPFYLENVLAYSTRQVGFLLATVPVALGITAPVSGAVSDRVGTRPITVVGLAVLVVGYYALSTMDTQTTTMGFILRFLPIGLGMGIFQSPNNSAIMGTAPSRQLGIVSGLLAITRTLGQTTGTAVIGAVWAARVFFYEGTTLPGGATEATQAAQVFGLNDAFLVVTALIMLALLLGIWGLVQAWRLDEL